MPDSRELRGARNRQIKELDKAYTKLIEEISSIYSDVELKEGQVFRFNNQHPAKKRRATEAFRTYRKKVEGIIKAGQAFGWENATKTYRKELEKRLERVKSHISVEDFQKQIGIINAITVDYKALDTFMNRKVGRASLSKRVWDIKDMAQNNIENALTDALGKGKSAQELARSIKRNLNQPDKLFRRIRDANGKLVPSEPMRSYKPGQGVYRSAHKNAMRLARTEINAAYKRSEQASMLRNNDIVGQRIRTSHSHKTEDICDQLQGDYPKDFVWENWHPQCMCIREFIQKSDEEFIAEIKSGKNVPPHLSKNYVKDVPANFKSWVNNNREKIDGWKTKPGFLTDNGY